MLLVNSKLFLMGNYIYSQEQSLDFYKNVFLTNKHHRVVDAFNFSQ